MMKVLIVIVALFVVSAVAQECADLQGAAPEDLVAYLGRADRKANVDCVTFAIRRIGKQRYQPAAPILARLLDFRRTPTDGEQAGVLTMHTFYPSIEALEEIGSASLASVLVTLGANDASELARENAVRVWMYFHRDDAAKGVALLKRDADETTDPAVQKRLLWAVDKAVERCWSDKIRCKAAAENGHVD